MSELQEGSPLWHQHPMGPRVQKFLSLNDQDYAGGNTQDIGAAVKDSFKEQFLAAIAKTPCSSEDCLIDLMDELIAMDQPYLALMIYERNQEIFSHSDFRGVLSLGIAAMLCHDLDAAEDYFIQAQNINTSEPAPYVNLSQIAFFKGNYDLALQICERGLRIDKNNLKLWQIYAEILGESKDQNLEQVVKDQAKKLSSWAGYSLSHYLEEKKDFPMLSKLFSGLYAMGERSPNFLIEYTAILGQIEDYEKLMFLVRDIDIEVGKNTPFQVYIHGAQAAIQLANKEQFFQLLNKAKSSPNFSPDFLPEIEALQKEADL